MGQLTACLGSFSALACYYRHLHIYLCGKAKLNTARWGLTVSANVNLPALASVMAGSGLVDIASTTGCSCPPADMKAFVTNAAKQLNKAGLDAQVVGSNALWVQVEDGSIQQQVIQTLFQLLRPHGFDLIHDVQVNDGILRLHHAFRF